MKNFTKDDIKPGMLIESRGMGLRMVMPYGAGYLAFVDEHGFYWELNNDLNEDLTDSDHEQFDIMKVYGYSSKANESMCFYTDNRELLWEREENDEEDEEYENEEAATKLLEKIADDFMTDLGKEFGMSDEEIETAKKEAKEAADRELAKRKKPCVKVNVDVDAEFEDMLKDLDDIMSIASVMTRLNEKYGM